MKRLNLAYIHILHLENIIQSRHENLKKPFISHSKPYGTRLKENYIHFHLLFYTQLIIKRNHKATWFGSVYLAGSDLKLFDRFSSLIG